MSDNKTPPKPVPPPPPPPTPLEKSVNYSERQLSEVVTFYSAPPPPPAPPKPGT